MARRVLMAEVSGGLYEVNRGMDDEKEPLGNIGMPVEAARKIGKSGEPGAYVTK